MTMAAKRQDLTNHHKFFDRALADTDPAIFDAIQKEYQRRSITTSR